MAVKKASPPVETETEAATAGSDLDQAPEAVPDPGGWFRNITPTVLTVVGRPSADIGPGEAIQLPYTPTHRGLIACDAPEPAPDPDAEQAPETPVGTPPSVPATTPEPPVQTDQIGE